MQEVDVNALSAPGFLKAWRAHGFHVVLGELQSSRQLHRVALASRLPIKQVALEAPDAAGRFAAGLLDVNFADKATLVSRLLRFPWTAGSHFQGLSGAPHRGWLLRGPFLHLGRL